jgi:hypothetical protein
MGKEEAGMVAVGGGGGGTGMDVDVEVEVDFVVVDVEAGDWDEAGWDVEADVVDVEGLGGAGVNWSRTSVVEPWPVVMLDKSVSK